MFAGIIAAGNGERLKSVSRDQIKPLLNVGGRPLIAWPLGALAQAGAASFVILSHSRARHLQGCLVSEFPGLKFEFLFKDTASSWESFRLVSQALSKRAPGFVVSTADAVYPSSEAARFISEARMSGGEAALAVTSFVDDEKPLWADLEPDGRVTAVGPRARSKTHATAGLYYLTREMAGKMPPAERFSSLREFWGWAVSRHRVSGIPLSKTVDVDRPEDIPVAEEFLTTLRSPAP